VIIIITAKVAKKRRKERKMEKR